MLGAAVDPQDGDQDGTRGASGRHAGFGVELLMQAVSDLEMFWQAGFDLEMVRHAGCDLQQLSRQFRRTGLERFCRLRPRGAQAGRMALPCSYGRPAVASFSSGRQALKPSR